MKVVQKNEQLMELLQTLKRAAIENNAPVWKAVAENLERPTRQRRVVNLYKIERYARDGETVVVPGKVLGTGECTKKLHVAAYSFSTDAQEKISKAGKCMSIAELVAKNPKGEKVRLMG